MNLHHAYEPRHGFTPIVWRGLDDLQFLEFGVLSLNPGEPYIASSGATELGLILLSGECHLKVGELDADLGPRKNVFDGYAYAAYIPLRTKFSLTAKAASEIALCSAPCEEEHPPAVVRPSDVNVRHVGKGNWTRTVTDIIGGNIAAQRLIVGETYNPPGNWSSSPPHRHDNDNPPTESDMEEVYFYRLNPSQGFGFQRVYDEGRGLDAVYTVRENDTVSIPYGYHPVVAAPGYQLYYLWMLAGEKRLLIPHDDPSHAWVKQSA